MPRTQYDKKPDIPVDDKPVKLAPSIDPAGRERQLTNLAINLAEKQLLEGTASPSVINHFLKLATKREDMERDILERQAQLLTAKTDSISASKDVKALYKDAIDAISRYSPSQE